MGLRMLLLLLLLLLMLLLLVPLGRLHRIEAGERARFQRVALAQIIAVGVLDAHVGVVHVLRDERRSQVHARGHSGGGCGSCRHRHGSALGCRLGALFLLAAPLGAPVGEPDLKAWRDGSVCSGNQTRDSPGSAPQVDWFWKTVVPGRTRPGSASAQTPSPGTRFGRR